MRGTFLDVSFPVFFFLLVHAGTCARAGRAGEAPELRSIHPEMGE